VRREPIAPHAPKFTSKESQSVRDRPRSREEQQQRFFSETVTVFLSHTSKYFLKRKRACTIFRTSKCARFQAGRLFLILLPYISVRFFTPKKSTQRFRIITQTSNFSFQSISLPIRHPLKLINLQQ
jgi:hypothetical protein